MKRPVILWPVDDQATGWRSKPFGILVRLQEANGMALGSLVCRMFGMCLWVAMRNISASYEHVGQHGGADYYGVVQHTKPCSLEAAADLMDELQRIGYILRPIKRATRKHHEARRRMAADFQKATSFPNK
jgi:hypothetical protein